MASGTKENKEVEVKEKLSPEDIQAYLNIQYEPTTDIEFLGRRLTVKKNLSLVESMAFVKAIVENCFDADTGEYTPEVWEFAVRLATIELYTDLELPEEITQKYDFVFKTDLYLLVKQVVDEDQYFTLIDASTEKVLNRAQSNVSALTGQINRMANELNNIEENLSAIFNGIDENTLTGIATALTNGSLDEEKLAKSVINQRAIM